MEDKKKNMLESFLESPVLKSIASAVICALIGILIGYVILLVINAEHASKAMSTILKNFMYYKVTSKKLYYLGSTLVKSVPLILCGISVLFAYKTGLFNIGAGGQYCIGIGASLWCALAWNLPWWVCVIAAVVVSGLWGAVAGFLKAYFNINEVIACIMLNWISLYLVNVLLHNEIAMDINKSETFSIARVSPSSLLPSLGMEKFFHNNEYISIAIPFAVIFAVVIFIVLEKTVFGYEIRATGLNKHAAKYAGMNEKKNIILSMAISGAIAGLAAALYYLTDIQAWKTSSSVPAMGFNGIAVAFLGGLHPIGVIFAGYFIQHITTGGSLIDMRYYNPQIADLISSIIIYVCAFALFIKFMLSKFSDKIEEKLGIVKKNVNDSETAVSKDGK